MRDAVRKYLAQRRKAAKGRDASGCRPGRSGERTKTQSTQLAMKLTKRRWFGLGMICLSLLMTVLSVKIKFDDVALSGGGSELTWVVIKRTSHAELIYASAFACFLIGISCVFWPKRNSNNSPQIPN